MGHDGLVSTRPLDVESTWGCGHGVDLGELTGSRLELFLALSSLFAKPEQKSHSSIVGPVIAFLQGTQTEVS